jgi:hypothetical protein
MRRCSRGERAATVSANYFSTLGVRSPPVVGSRSTKSGRERESLPDHRHRARVVRVRL